MCVLRSHIKCDVRHINGDVRHVVSLAACGHSRSNDACIALHSVTGVRLAAVLAMCGRRLSRVMLVLPCVVGGASELRKLCLNSAREISVCLLVASHSLAPFPCTQERTCGHLGAYFAHHDGRGGVRALGLFVPATCCWKPSRFTCLFACLRVVCDRASGPTTRSQTSSLGSTMGKKTVGSPQCSIQHQCLAMNCPDGGYPWGMGRIQLARLALMETTSWYR